MMDIAIGQGEENAGNQLIVGHHAGAIALFVGSRYERTCQALTWGRSYVPLWKAQREGIASYLTRRLFSRILNVMEA